MDQVPIAPQLFTWPSDDPHLVGSSCVSCGTTTFPVQSACPRCTSTEMEERLLPQRGTLWSFTVQRFRPKSPYRGPDDFEPYGVGYVDLAGEVLVESRLTVDDLATLAIGAPMELVVAPWATDGTGHEVVNFSFRPVA